VFKRAVIPRRSSRMLGIRCTGLIRSSVNVCRPHSGFPWHSCRNSKIIIVLLPTVRLHSTAKDFSPNYHFSH